MNNDAISTDRYLKDVPDWQRTNLESFRNLVHEVDPAISEEIKWGVPVFLLNKRMVLSMASFKAHTKYNFIANGAELNDPKGLFNNGLDSKKSRSIDLQEGVTIDQAALKDLITQAIAKL